MAASDCSRALVTCALTPHRRTPRPRLARRHGRARHRRRADPKTVNNARTCLSVALDEAVPPRTLTQEPVRARARAPRRPARVRLPRLHEIEPLPRRLRRPLPSARGVADRHRCPHLRGRRHPVARFGSRRRRGAHLAATRPLGIEHDADKGQAIPLVQLGPRLVDDAQSLHRNAIALGRPMEVGSSFPLARAAAATPAAPSRCRRIAGRSTTGTSGRSRTPASATCRFTRYDTPQPRCGSPPPPADLCPAPTRPPLYHHHRGTLRAPRAILHPTGSRADRGADHFLRRRPTSGRARRLISQASDRRRARPAATAGSPAPTHASRPGWRTPPAATLAAHSQANARCPRARTSRGHLDFRVARTGFRPAFAASYTQERETPR